MVAEWGDNQLPFVAVGRVKDQVTLAYFIATDVEEQREQTKDVFRKLLTAASSKLSASQRTRLQWNTGSVCCMMDTEGELLYCVVTSQLVYPERLAYQLLGNLAVHVRRHKNLHDCGENDLNAELTPCMRGLVAQYEDPKQLSAQLGQPSTMAGRDSGLGPMSQAAAMHANMNLRDRRMMLYGGICLIFVIIIALAVFLSNRGGGPDDNHMAASAVRAAVPAVADQAAVQSSTRAAWTTMI
jgi:hypothetical protein